MLLDYPARSLTVSTDKMAPLSGLASTFATQTGDVYLSGLWLNGLPEGLPWSSIGPGRGQHGSRSRSTIPPSRRARTWSWASLDGPVLCAAGKYAFVDAVVHAYSMPGASRTQRCCESKHSDVLGPNPFRWPLLKGMVGPLERLSGFTAEQRQLLLDHQDSRRAFYVPRAFWDDPDCKPGDLEGVTALHIARVDCGNRDRKHTAACGTGLAHCLLVQCERAREKTDLSEDWRGPVLCGGFHWGRQELSSLWYEHDISEQH